MAGLSLLAPTSVGLHHHAGFVPVVDDVVLELVGLNEGELRDIDVRFTSATGGQSEIRPSGGDGLFIYDRNPLYYAGLTISLPESHTNQLIEIRLKVAGESYRLSPDELGSVFQLRSGEDGRLSLELRAAAVSGGRSFLPPFHGLLNYRGDLLVALFSLTWAVIVVAGAWIVLRYEKLLARYADTLWPVVALIGFVLFRLHVSTWVLDPLLVVAAFATVVAYIGSGRFSRSDLRRPGNWSFSGDVIALAVLAGSTLITQIPYLGETYMWTDEFFSFYPALRIAEVGEPVYEGTGYHYGRAAVYHRILAETMSAFGFDEFGGRILNVFANLAIVAVLYMWLRPRGRVVALTAGLLFLLSPFVLAQTRIIRMYPVFAFTFLLVAVSYYKTTVEPANTNNLIREKTGFALDLRWLAILLLVGFFAYDTHRLIVQFIFGLLLFHGVASVSGHLKRQNAFLLFVVVLMLLAGAYIRYETLNLYAAYYVNPLGAWAENSPVELLTYPEHIQTIAPYGFLAMAIAGFYLLRRKDLLLGFTLAVFLGGFLFMMPQRQNSARYIYGLMPFLPIVAVLSLQGASRIVLASQRWRIALCGCAALLMFAQVWAFSTEYRDFGDDDWEAAIDYVQALPREEYTLVTGGHATTRLWAQGLESDYYAITNGSESPTYVDGERHERFDVETVAVSRLASEIVGTTDMTVFVLPERISRQVEQYFESSRLPQFSGPYVHIVRSTTSSSQ